MSDLDDDDREVLARLKALPHEGTEPSWDRFQRELDHKLAAPAPAPWWRRWWAPAIGATLAAATATAVVLWPHGRATPATEVAVIDHDAAPEQPAPPTPEPAPRPGDVVLALGSEGELDDADLDDEDVVSGVLAALDDDGDLAVLDDVPDEPTEGLVPDLDLDWVDDLDDADLDAVTAWLDEEEPS